MLMALMKYYTHTLPTEDLELFKRASERNDIKMHIIPKFLLYYRIHGKQVSHTYKT